MIGETLEQREQRGYDSDGSRLDIEYDGVLRSIAEHREAYIAEFPNLSSDIFKTARSYPLLNWEQVVILSSVKDRGLKTKEAIGQEIAYGPNEANIQKGRDASESMINCNLRLVISIAKRLRKEGSPIDDYIQEGCIGLERAVIKFDWKRGYKFSTYATAWIKNFIIRGVNHRSNLIYVPHDLVGNMVLISATESELEASLGRTPRIDEISQETEIPTSEIIRLREARALNRITYLGDTQPDSKTSLESTVPDQSLDIDNLIARAASQQVIGRLMHCLNQRERAAIERIYISRRNETMKEIALQLGVDVNTLGNIRTRALSKMRSYSNDHKIELTI